MLASERFHLAAEVLDDRTEGHRVVREVGRALIRSGEEQEIFDELRHRLGFLGDGVDLVHVGSDGVFRVALEQFSVRSQYSKRRAQLVGGIGDEPLLAFVRGADRAKCNAGQPDATRCSCQEAAEPTDEEHVPERSELAIPGFKRTPDMDPNSGVSKFLGHEAVVSTVGMDIGCDRATGRRIAKTGEINVVNTDRTRVSEYRAGGIGVDDEDVGRHTGWQPVVVVTVAAGREIAGTSAIAVARAPVWRLLGLIHCDTRGFEAIVYLVVDILAN